MPVLSHLFSSARRVAATLMLSVSMLLAAASVSSAAPTPKSKLTVSIGVASGQLSATVVITGKRAAGTLVLESQRGKTWSKVKSKKIKKAGTYAIVSKAPSAATKYRVGFVPKRGKRITSRTISVKPVGTNVPTSGTTTPPAGSAPAGGSTPGSAAAPTIVAGATPTPAPAPGATQAPIVSATAIPTPGSTSTPAPGATPTPTPVAYPEPKIVEPADIKQAPAAGAGGTVVFDGTQAAVRSGDIIAAGTGDTTPEGLLVKVTSVTTSGGNTVVTTEPTTLVDALPSGSFDVSIAPDGDYTGTDAATGRTSRSGRADSKGNSVLQGIRRNLKCEGGGTASIKGSISFSSGFNFSATWSLGRLVDSAQFTGDVQTSASLRADAQAAANCALGPVRLLPAPIRFAPFTVQVGPIPVVFTPVVDLFLEASGEISANLTAEARASFKVSAGLRYDAGQGVKPISAVSSDLGYTPPTLDSEAEISAAIKPRLELLIYGAAGPSLDLSAKTALKAELTKDPWWTLTETIAVGASLTVPALAIDVSKDPVYSKTVTLAQSTTDPPTPAITVDGPGLKATADEAGIVARVKLAAGQRVTLYAEDRACNDLTLTDASGNQLPAEITEARSWWACSSERLAFKAGNAGTYFVRAPANASVAVSVNSVAEKAVGSLPFEGAGAAADVPGRVTRFEISVNRGEEIDLALEGDREMCLWSDAGASMCGGESTYVTPGSAKLVVFVSAPGRESGRAAALTISRPKRVAVTVDGSSVRSVADYPGQRLYLDATGGTGANSVALMDAEDEGLTYGANSGVTTFTQSLTSYLGDQFFRVWVDRRPYSLVVDPYGVKTVDVSVSISSDVVTDVAAPGRTVPVSFTRPGQVHTLRFPASKGQFVRYATSDGAGEQSEPLLSMGFGNAGEASWTGGGSNAYTSSDAIGSFAADHTGTYDVSFQLVRRAAGTAKLSVSTDVDANVPVDGGPVAVKTTIPGQHVILRSTASNRFVTLASEGLDGTRFLTLAAGGAWLGWIFSPEAGGQLSWEIDPSTADLIDAKVSVLSVPIAETEAPTASTPLARRIDVGVPGRAGGVRFTAAPGVRYRFGFGNEADGPKGPPSGTLAVFDNANVLVTDGSDRTFSVDGSKQMTVVFVPSDNRTGHVEIKVERDE